MKKITIEYIKNLKNNTHSFATLTAYDYISAQIIDAANIPLILVGDSASMMIYGYDTTIPISMDEILLITKAVSRGAQRSLVVADMPFLSYQTSVEDAVKNAGILIKDGGAGAVGRGTRAPLCFVQRPERGINRAIGRVVAVR